ncbi:MAG: lytic polysaccharide monooxygenase [Myxococcales bacterium]|nr:lytic polysaccharide monooxygenase [Myxococcales bacterium]
MRRLLAPAVALAALTLAPASASAHIELTSHIARHSKYTQKTAPCGDADDGGPGENIYVYEPGETVTFAWHEFVDHPGHYRVAFDDAGSDDFIDPATADERYSNDAVLVDGIADVAGVSDYEVDVTLPAIECAACTVQILQIMTDKPPYGDGNDVYYHCVDVQLVEGGGPDMLAGEGCGCVAAAPGRGALGALLGVLLLGLTWRRGQARRRP